MNVGLCGIAVEELAEKSNNDYHFCMIGPANG